MKKDIVAALHKSLNKRKESDIKNPVISEVKGLLEHDTIRDTEVLRTIGLNSSLVQSESERGRMLELEKQEKFYKGSIFIKEQIIALATKYRLKFLPSTLFSAYLTPLVATDIRNLERDISKSMTEEQAAKRNLSVEEYLAGNPACDFRFDAHQLKSKFFILAPAKCFKTEKKAAFSLKSPDPILFYTPDGIHYRFLRKWGSDFTIFRRILGIVFKSRRTMLWSAIISIALITGIVSMFTHSDVLLFNLFIFPCIMFTYMPDWEKDFFGERYVTSNSSYF